MPNKKKRPTDNKVLSQPKETSKKFLFNELDPHLKEDLKKLLKSYQQCDEKAEKLDKNPLSEALQKEITDLIPRFEKFLDLFNTHLQLKNLGGDYNNVDYYQINLRIQLASLTLLLGDRNKATRILKQTLKFEHADLIKVYRLIKINNLFPENDEQINILLKIIECQAVAIGNREQIKDNEKLYLAFGIGNKTETLKKFAQIVFDYYLRTKNNQRLEKLLSVLSSSSENFLEEYGQQLLTIYIQYILELNKTLTETFSNIDRVLEQSENLVSPAHYFLLAEHCTYNHKLDASYYNLALKYLRQGQATGDIKLQTQLAKALIFNVESDSSNILEGLTLVQKTLHTISKSKAPETLVEAEASCHFLMGMIYDRNLLPNHSLYKQNSKKALEHFELASKLHSEEACIDLAYIYRTGSHSPQIPQDLQKSAQYYAQSIKLGNGLTHAELGLNQLQQVSLTSDPEVRKQLVSNAIDNMKKVFLVPDYKILTDSEVRLEFLAAKAYLFQDFQLQYPVDESSRQVTERFLPSQLDSTPVNKNNADLVQSHLLNAIKLGYHYADLMLGILYHNGSYLTKNLVQAKIHYKKFLAQSPHDLLPLTCYLLDLILEQVKTSTSPEEQNDYLLEALTLNSCVLKEEDEHIKSSFNELIQLYRTFTVDSEQLSSIQNKYKRLRTSNEIQFYDKEIPIAVLKNTIEKTKSQLLELTKQENNLDEKNIANLLATLNDLSKTLKRLKSDVPKYSDLLVQQSALQCSPILFLKLPLRVQISLIRNISHWHMVSDSEHFIFQYLLLLNFKEISNFEFMQLMLTLTHFRSQTGLEEGVLKTLFFDKLELYTPQNIDDFAKLIYIFAILHANGSQNLITELLTPVILKLSGPMISYLQQHCWEAQEHSGSQIYHGLNYLNKIYTKELSYAADSPLSQFMQFQASLDTYSISHSQQQAYETLSSLNSNFQHEASVGGRRVDFYNQETNEVVFFHGPSHYLYSPEGKPVTETSATVLNEKTLEVQGVKVYSIPYWKWDEANTPDLKEQLLRDTVDSLKISPHTATKTVAEVKIHCAEKKPNQSSSSFWRALPKSTWAPQPPEVKNLDFFL